MTAAGPTDGEGRDDDERAINYGALTGYIGYQLRQAQSAVFRDFSSIVAEFGVTPGEFSLLTLVLANPGITQGYLAAAYRLDKSTLSLAVKDLVSRGLVTRSRSADDRRYFALLLTKDGRGVLEKVAERVERQERRMDAVLHPGERALLLDILVRISHAFDRKP